MARLPRGDRFSLLYRIGWRIEYALLHVMGPAAMDDARDPRVRMRNDYERRRRLHQERAGA